MNTKTKKWRYKIHQHKGLQTTAKHGHRTTQTIPREKMNGLNEIIAKHGN